VVLVLAIARTGVSDDPNIDWDCLFQGLSEQHVLGWFEEFYINGEAAFRRVLLADIANSGCLPGTEDTPAPTMTS
jgi:hypothetical protein